MPWSCMPTCDSVQEGIASSENGLSRICTANLHAGSPFNPFGKFRSSIQGLAIDQPPNSFESEADELFGSVGLEGSVGTWTWQAEYGLSRQEMATSRA